MAVEKNVLNWLKKKAVEYKIPGFYRKNAAFWDNLSEPVKLTLIITAIFSSGLIMIGGVPGLALSVLQRALLVGFLAYSGRSAIKGNVVLPLVIAAIATAGFFLAPLVAIPAIVSNILLFGLAVGAIAGIFWRLDTRSSMSAPVHMASYVWRSLERIAKKIPFVFEHGFGVAADMAMGRRHILETMIEDINALAGYATTALTYTGPFLAGSVHAIKRAANVLGWVLRKALTIVAIAAVISLIAVAGLYLSGNIAIAMPVLLSLKAFALGIPSALMSGATSALGLVNYVMPISLFMMKATAILTTVGLVVGYVVGEIKHPIDAVSNNVNRPTSWGIWRSLVQMSIFSTAISTAALFAASWILPTTVLTVPLMATFSVFMGVASSLALTNIYHKHFQNTVWWQAIDLIKDAVGFAWDTVNITYNQRSFIYKVIETVKAIPEQLNRLAMPQRVDPAIVIPAAVGAAVALEVATLAVSALNPIVAVPLFTFAALEANKNDRPHLATGLGVAAASSIVGFGPAATVPLGYRAVINVKDGNYGMAGAQAGAIYLVNQGLGAIGTKVGALGAIGGAAYIVVKKINGQEVDSNIYPVIAGSVAVAAISNLPTIVYGAAGAALTAGSAAMSVIGFAGNCVITSVPYVVSHVLDNKVFYGVIVGGAAVTAAVTKYRGQPIDVKNCAMGAIALCNGYLLVSCVAEAAWNLVPFVSAATTDIAQSAANETVTETLICAIDENVTSISSSVLESLGAGKLIGLATSAAAMFSGAFDSITAILVDSEDLSLSNDSMVYDKKATSSVTIEEIDDSEDVFVDAKEPETSDELITRLNRILGKDVKEASNDFSIDKVVDELDLYQNKNNALVVAKEKITHTDVEALLAKSRALIASHADNTNGNRKVL